MINKISTNQKVMSVIAFISGIISLYYGYCFIFVKNCEITDFSHRIFSVASSNNIEISSLTNKYSIFLLSMAVFTFCICCLFKKQLLAFLSFCYNKIFAIWQFFSSKLIIINCGISGSVAICLLAILVFILQKPIIGSLAVSLGVFAVGFVIIQLIFKKFLYNKITTEGIDLLSIFSISGALSVLYGFILDAPGFSAVNTGFFLFILTSIFFLDRATKSFSLMKATALWLSGIISCAVILNTILSFFTSFGFYVTWIICAGISLITTIKYGFIFSRYYNKLLNILFPFAVASCVISLFTEVTYTFKSRGVNIYIGAVAIAILIISATIFAFFINKKDIVISSKVYYFFAILGLALASFMRAFSGEIKIDVFEDANHGVAIFDFLNFGELPLIDNFDAHMLSRFFSGVIYQLLNNDIVTAITRPYQYMVAVVILVSVFYILTQFINEETSFILVLLLPICQVLDVSVFPNYFWIGLSLLAFSLFWIKKQKENSKILLSVVFWLLAASSVFFMLDVGASFGIAMVLCGFAYLIKNRYYKPLRTFIICGTSVAIAILTVILSLFNFHFTEFFDWVFKFINTVFCNQNWGIGTVYLDMLQMFLSIIHYVLLPMAVSLLLFLKIHKTLISINLKYSLSFLALAFFLNSSRIIVRHSILESAMAVIMFEWLILLLLLIDLFKSKNNQGNLKTGYPLIVLILVGFIAIYPNAIKTQVPVAKFTNNLKTVSRSIYNLKTQPEKSSPTSDYKAIVSDMNKLFDLLLEEDETYIDFSNHSVWYPLTGRRNPAYVNQCPALVNGEKGQLEFIEQAKNSNSSIVLMPKDNYILSYNIDQIPNTDRHYLITEYICNNYRPLCSIQSYAVWCSFDKFDKFSKIVDDEFELLDDYYYNLPKYYIHPSGLIPYLWANYDTKEIPKEAMELQKQDDGYHIDYSKINSKNGNYLILNITAKEEKEFNFYLTDNENHTSTFKFDLVPGCNTYKVRVSSDICWYSQELDTIVADKSEDITLNQVLLCEGDVAN